MDEVKLLLDIKARKKGKYIKVLMWDEINRSSLSTHAKSMTAASKIIMRHQKGFIGRCL